MAYIGAEPDGKGSAERFIFTATGSTTDTVTHDDDGLAINYEANHVSVYLNGVKQVVGTDVTASNGSTLVFASNLAEDDVVEAIALSSFQPADTVPASTGGTFTGNIVIGATNGNQTLDVASHDLVDGGLKLGGTLVTASATELNLLDGKTSVGSPSITDNGNATAMTIDTSEDVTYTGNIIMPTNKKIKQKGSFMQSSTHQALTLGY